MHPGQVTPLEKLGKERLSQVLTFLGGSSFAPKMGVHRIPVDFTETRERAVRLRRVPLARGQDHAPMRRAKICRLSSVVVHLCRKVAPRVCRSCGKMSIFSP